MIRSLTRFPRAAITAGPSVSDRSVVHGSIAVVASGQRKSRPGGAW